MGAIDGNGLGALVLFSNAKVKERTAVMDRFKALDIEISESHNPNKFDILVVGKDQLKKTSKLLIAVAAGKPVVLETWVTESANAGKLLPLNGHLPPMQKEWGYNPAKIHMRSGLLDGKTIYITPALKRSWGTEGYRDVETLANLMGAERVVSKTTRGLHEDEDDSIIVLVSVYLTFSPTYREFRL